MMQFDRTLIDFKPEIPSMNIPLAANALIVSPAAGIAELHYASALHVVAALRFLHPELRSGALLEFGSADELFEGFLLAI
jgi:hypothetical protein